MNKPVAITAHVDADTLAMLEELAAAQGRSVADLAGEAVRLLAAGGSEAPGLSETELLASIEEAERQIDGGAFVTQDAVEQWVADLRRDAAA